MRNGVDCRGPALNLGTAGAAEAAELIGDGEVTSGMTESLPRGCDNSLCLPLASSRQAGFAHPRLVGGAAPPAPHAGPDRQPASTTVPGWSWETGRMSNRC